jgi:hypothetical protein
MKKRLDPQPLSIGKSPSPLSSRAKPRDLQFRGPFLETFFDRAHLISCIAALDRLSRTHEPPLFSP